MYLRELFIENSGPIERLHIDLAFNETGQPLPHIIVGKNGTGKTNLLSIIADALMEGASAGYSDILNHQAVGRSYFRILGGKTVTTGKDNTLSLLRFREDDSDLFYLEHIGKTTSLVAKSYLPNTLASGATWTDEKPTKSFNINEEKSRSVYSSGVYMYSPYSRSEHPFWFNRDSVLRDEFDVADRFSQVLDKPLFVEHGLEALTQWILGVLTESRMKVENASYVDGSNNERIAVELDSSTYLHSQAALWWANRILQIITADESAEFYWINRHNPRKVGVQLSGVRLTTGLNGLSGGQATLLALFGTILRYNDSTGLAPGNAKGVVVIDELDAHMHVDLLIDTLPKLIAIFPGIQFIVTSHSPFFALGMEKTFSADGIRIIELPSGLALSAETYGEFDTAINAMRDTRAFESELKDLVKASETAVVLVGGKTDVGYFNAAARVLGFNELVGKFEGVGKFDANDDKNSGDGNLTNAVHFLQANPGITKRTIVAVYDCDATKIAKSDERVSVIKLTTVPHRKMKIGIENMLPDTAFGTNMYDDKVIEGKMGDNFTKPVFNKNRACEMLCGENADPDNFANFRPILEQIKEILFPVGEDGGASQPDSTEPQHS